MNPRDHELFRRYPLTSQINVSTGPAPVPYHVYDGNGLLIGGTAPLAAVEECTASEQVMPIATTDNRAFMAVWIFDFADASLGPHLELQISLYVSRHRLKKVAPHPFALLHMLAFDPDIRQLVYRLWNNTHEVVAYNSELLGLDAQFSKGHIQHKDNKIGFEFTDDSDQRIVEGEVSTPARPPMRTLTALLQLFGISGLMRFSSQPFVSVQVMNRTDAVIKHNAEAQTYTSTDKQLLRFWDSATDQLQFRDKALQALSFQPQFVQHFNGFKFVYLNPHNVGDNPIEEK